MSIEFPKNCLPLLRAPCIRTKKPFFDLNKWPKSMCNPRLFVSSIFENTYSASMAGDASMGFIEGCPFSSVFVSCPSVSLASIPSTRTDKSSSNSLMALFANISGMSSMSSKEVQICHTLLPSFFLRISKHWWTSLFSKFNPFVGRRIHYLHFLYASLKIIEFIAILTMHFNHCILKLSWGGGWVGVHFPLINNARCDVLEYHVKNPSIYLYHQRHQRHALLKFIHPLWQKFLHIPTIVVCKVISPKFENPKPSPVGRLQCNNYFRVHWLMNSCALGRQAKYTSTRSCPRTYA